MEAGQALSFLDGIILVMGMGGGRSFDVRGDLLEGIFAREDGFFVGVWGNGCWLIGAKDGEVKID